MQQQHDDKRTPYLTIPQAAAALNMNRTTAWANVKDTGALYGIPAIQKTRTRYVLSRAAVERVVREMQDGTS